LTLLELAARHRLDAPTMARLRALAQLDREPAQLGSRLARSALVAGAALGGFGLILWVAANWMQWSHLARFALLEGVLLFSIGGAIVRPTWRTACAWVAFLTLGALLAAVGQTYQTGADLWELFALWGGLGAVLALGARSDSLWAGWVMVAMVAVSLWTQDQGGRLSGWRLSAETVGLYQLAQFAALVPALWLSAPLRRLTGAGFWAWWLALALAVPFLVILAVLALFADSPGHPLLYLQGLALLGVAALCLASRRGFDLPGLSLMVLGLDVLLVLGAAHFLLEGRRPGDPTAHLFALTVIAAGVLGVSVWQLVRLHATRRQGVGA